MTGAHPQRRYYLHYYGPASLDGVLGGSGPPTPHKTPTHIDTPLMMMPLQADGQLVSKSAFDSEVLEILKDPKPLFDLVKKYPQENVTNVLFADDADSDGLKIIE